MMGCYCQKCGKDVWVGADLCLDCKYGPLEQEAGDE